MNECLNGSLIGEFECVNFLPSLSRSCVNVKEEQDDEHQVSCSQMVYETFLQPKLSRVSATP